jgi:hypothetical protein
MLRFSFMFLLLISLTDAHCFAQNRVMYGVKDKDEKPAFWYEWVSTQAKRLSLDSILSTSHSTHFRLWSQSQVIEVWQANNSAYEGQLTTWTEEYTDSDEEPTNRIYIQKKAIDFSAVQSIKSLILSSGINKIPADNSIPGWKQGFDGTEYLIETADSKSYYLKSYWTPRAQDSLLKEASIVQKFVDQTFQASDAKAEWENLIAAAPFKCSTNGFGVRCKILPANTRRKMKKERSTERKRRNKTLTLNRQHRMLRRILASQSLLMLFTVNEPRRPRSTTRRKYASLHG